jgi:hypothetical protein
MATEANSENFASTSISDHELVRTYLMRVLGTLLTFAPRALKLRATMSLPNLSFPLNNPDSS